MFRSTDDKRWRPGNPKERRTLLDQLTRLFGQRNSQDSWTYVARHNLGIGRWMRDAEKEAEPRTGRLWR